MKCAIMDYAQARLGAADAAALLTVFAVTPLGRFTLDDWRRALSLLSGKTVVCTCYRDVGRVLHQLIRETAV